MSYDYQKERPGLFTDEGQRMLLSVRDRWRVSRRADRHDEKR